ncbi:MAG: carboxypeptidase-like regulatory domain-containing protein, partial [Bacteroidetes bacterium]|nr:carboxypeptidase-like regulatory domain-containing protein [Bacteroidota bacterium]
MSFFMLMDTVFAQTMILKPPTAQESDGDYEVKLLLKQDAEFRLEWTNLDASALNLTGRNAKLIIGRASNTYQTLSLDVNGNRADLVPNNIGLSVGRYFARITNSTARTAGEIQQDYTANPESIFYSNEVQIIIEAGEAPSIIAPRGNTTNATPTFQWTAVSGVPSYWLIVSSTPFDIVEDDEGGITIEGATVVWQYITKTTTADYGDINRESPFTDEAPPLNANQEYSYTVLNVYEENNPVYTSPVFGGIVPFIYVDPNAVPKTTLVRPNNNVELFAEETITFEWTNVPEASNYTVNLFQVMKQQGIDVTVPIWSGTTTNNLIEFPALQTLKSGRYQWNVVSNNTKGGGTTSSSRFFQYNVETGEFSVRVLSASDNSSLLGVELSARAISGGVTPSLPYFVQSDSYSDSLVAGTYEFTAEKQGFETTSTTSVIRDQRTTYVQMQMNPLPSSVSGVIKDNAGQTVEDAVVRTVKSDDGSVKTTTTGVNGDYSLSLNQGSYTISVSKSGYISPSNRTVTLGLDEQKNLSDPFILTNDQATVSGTIFNEDGDAVSRATVRITNGSQQYEAQSNGSGAYQFTVSSGNWTISVEKIGFVKPEDATVSLSTGDILQSQDFTLTGNANQVTGFVRERITNEDGSTGLSPFGNVEVRAVPSVGTAISTTTSGNGQYTLSLKSGSYSIVAVEENYASNQERELVIGIAVGETISGMDFEMVPNASSVSGTVSLPNGNGVSSATVSVLNVGTTQTNSSGYYSMSVPNGSHRISVSKTGLVSPSPETVSLSAGQDLTGINFEMTPNAGSISGKVSSSGLALTNTQLRARNTSTSQVVSLTNGSDGSYTFNLQSGSWVILAQKTGFLADSSSTITIGPGQSVINQNFSLVENTFTLRGTVTDGTNAIRNASVSISDGDGFSQITQTQINGTYAFSIPAGVNYTILVEKDGYKSASGTSGVQSAGSTRVSDFTLSSNPSSVAGTVNVSGGGILAGAKIYALNGSGQKVDSTTSKSDGTYVLGLNPNSYTLRVQKA